MFPLGVCTLMELKIGDLVQLKSGGPIMTVESITGAFERAMGEGQVHCVWFDSQGHVQYENFSEEVLKCKER